MLLPIAAELQRAVVLRHVFVAYSQTYGGCVNPAHFEAVVPVVIFRRKPAPLMECCEAKKGLTRVR